MSKRRFCSFLWCKNVGNQRCKTGKNVLMYNRLKEERKLMLMIKGEQYGNQTCDASGAEGAFF